MSIVKQRIKRSMPLIGQFFLLESGAHRTAIDLEDAESCILGLCHEMG